MKKNRRGATPGTFLVTLMIGLLLIIAVIAMSPAAKEQVGQARTNLDCTNTSLSPAETGACIVVDWTFFGFVAVGLAVAITWILAKRVIRINTGGG